MKGIGERRRARILAFQALYSYEISGSDAESLLSFDWEEGELKVELRLFAALIIKGSLEHLAEIDGIIRKNLRNWDFDRMEKVCLAILRMSVYALYYQKDIPPKVVIDEAVEIAKDFGTSESYRFVNGMLDNIKKDMNHEHTGL